MTMSNRRRLSSPGVSVIIVTYNSQNQIGNCLKSLFNFWPKKLPLQTTIIDNNSTDNTIRRIKSFKHVKVVTNKRNVGFASAVNTGMGLTKYSLVLLINPDTIFYQDSVRKLVSCARTHKAGIAGGKMLRTDGSTHGTYVKRPGFLTALFEFTNLKKIFPNNWWHRNFYYENISIPSCFEVDAVSGGYMMIDRSLTGKDLFFDENFFMYLEDIDFCLEAKQRGIKVMYCTDSVITHIGGASSPNKSRIHHQAWESARRYYFSKHLWFGASQLVMLAFELDNLALKMINIFRNNK